MKTMDYSCVGGVLIVAHLAQNPSDDEWALWMKRMAQEDYKSVLIVTDGGAPTPAQRKQTNAFWEGKNKPKMAVISDSVVVRGAIFAFYWLFKSGMRPFPTSRLDAALAFLEVPDASHPGVRNVVRRLRLDLKTQRMVA